MQSLPVEEENQQEEKTVEFKWDNYHKDVLEEDDDDFDDDDDDDEYDVEVVYQR